MWQTILHPVPDLIVVIGGGYAPARTGEIQYSWNAIWRGAAHAGVTPHTETDE